MKFTPLTKTEAKLAEKTTTPIINLSFNHPKKATKEQKELQSQISKMFDWQYTKSYNSRKGLETTKGKKAHITKHFGKPLYHAQYEYKEAVWGFQVEETQIIIYYSTKGFAVQVSKDCSGKEAAEILTFICSKLEK